tara:strand:- start:326 stop:721 length:396 start_codon:yes stop_codon:yes gene_type:complete
MPRGNPVFKHTVGAYRSGLEKVTDTWLKDRGVPVKYETFKIEYTQPPKNRAYTPDFLLPNGVIIETKGLFTVGDRMKHLWVKSQHPKLDIRFVFSNSRAKIYKGSKTTYAMWCKKNGFKYADKEIPESWLK